MRVTLKPGAKRFFLVTRFWLCCTAVFNLVLTCMQMWLTIYHMMQHWCRLLFETAASACLGLRNSASLLTLTQLKHQKASSTPTPSKLSWELYLPKTPRWFLPPGMRKKKFANNHSVKLQTPGQSSNRHGATWLPSVFDPSGSFLGVTL